MRRFLETDAVIIAALILVTGIYKLGTSAEVRDGLSQFVQSVRDRGSEPDGLPEVPPSSVVRELETESRVVVELTPANEYRCAVIRQPSGCGQLR